MELLHGKTLREELQQQRLEAGRALRILSGVCAAVEAGHRRHVIHRDIKPENIFLVSSETGEIPKVLDFGLAKYLTNPLTEPTLETGAGVLMGTLHYMAPEQLQGGQADTSWDLWAVAALAYEMLTGVHPFAHQNLAESIGATLSGRFTPISDHLPQAPPSWQEFFDRALALDPDKRPDSARSLYSELERTLSQQG
jgi:serine/threonine-protein kinase